ncbi:multicopper oxidase family protein [Mycolicibacterium brumae]|uniref:multicopper oxidase family protein n=1 Tax=Mycolicibacterium brumae TaxID=85968 RepID=UPI000A9802E2|nr:multicopper oxidase family protein [Mycolicibacterium brumae]UWW08176.1 multicopper oxidase family protein [Mycolicibacterium brumae]
MYTPRENARESSSGFGRELSRRGFLITAAGGLVLAAGCGQTSDTADSTPTYADAIEQAEAARPRSGRTVQAVLTAKPQAVDLGGVIAQTQAYSPELPGPLLRAKVGDQLEVTVVNELSKPTSLHWHGLALRNDMDGAEPATPNIAQSERFTYRFTAPHPGTYWAHPHTPLDADRGLYVPVVIDAADEATDYDAEWIVMIDDWTDGVGRSPEQVFEDLNKPMGHMPGMHSMEGMGEQSDSLLGAGGDVTYPHHVINGRIPSAPTSFRATPGQRIRMRIINAGADTAYRIALGGHTMTITHTDGFAVQPVETDAVLVGMGERYDAIVTAGDGVFPLVAAAEGKDGLARANLVTAEGHAPEAGFRPAELTGRVLTIDELRSDPSVDLGALQDPVELSAALTGGMGSYDWGINGKRHPDIDPFRIGMGDNAVITFANHTMMWHPMHLHGHTFQVLRPDGSRGPRKDTVIVKPMEAVKVALVANNPGTWLLHCHNTYHMDAGMMTQLNYT